VAAFELKLLSFVAAYVKDGFVNEMKLNAKITTMVVANETSLPFRVIYIFTIYCA
jgi:hypothetical protein